MPASYHSFLAHSTACRVAGPPYSERNFERLVVADHNGVRFVMRLGQYRYECLRRLAVRALAAASVLSFALLFPAARASAYSGIIIDAETGMPVVDALVALGDKRVRTDAAGAFAIDGDTNVMRIRAYGYLRTQRVICVSRSKPLEIQLRPFVPRAIFASLSAFTDRAQRDKLFALFKTTRVNALVVEVKGEDGTLLWNGPSPTPQIGIAEHRVGTKTIAHILRRLHNEGIYVIARIVVFKDDVLVARHPEVALRGNDGSLLQEKDGYSWADPRIKSVWDYDAAIAVRAARLGFDEIQFDYIRFPVTRAPPRFCAADCSEMRRAAVRGFLAEAWARLAKYNVFISADVFGYTIWDPGDANIGQKLEDIAPEVDYICPMLYPSSFRNGIPASPMPLDKPDKIVELSLRHAQLRTGLVSVRYRPWLQAFADFNFDHREFGRLEIGLQTAAADAFGSDGWMLWQRHSIYVAADLPAHDQ